MRDDELLAQMVQRAAAGDATAMECLLVRYDAHLLQYIGRRLPHELRRTIDPQDVLQDIHFEIFRRSEYFAATDVRSALRWLLNVARNRLIDVVRMHNAAKRGGDRRVSAEEAGSGDHRTQVEEGDEADRSMITLLQDLMVYERTPSRSAVAHELLRALQQSLNRLPADYRQAIELRYMEGLSVEDAALRMAKSEGSLKMLCNRGLTMLRTDLHSMSFCL